ncbi:MAG: hypothetical protein N2C14_22065 [Planctomycetales bacterium]
MIGQEFADTFIQVAHNHHHQSLEAPLAQALNQSFEHGHPGFNRLGPSFFTAVSFSKSSIFSIP